LLISFLSALWSGGPEGRIVVLNAKDGTILSEGTLPSPYLPGEAKEREGNMVCSLTTVNETVWAGGADGNITIFGKEGKCLRQLCGHKGAITALEFCGNVFIPSDGNENDETIGQGRESSLVLSGSADGSVRFWDTEVRFVPLFPSPRSFFSFNFFLFSVFCF
jgi:WD40 repeat protein